MRNKRLRSVWLAIIVCLAVTVPTYAFLGIGDLVYDPAVYGQAVEEVTRLVQQYEQLVRSYDMLQSQYDQMVWNAKRVPVDMSARYRAVRTPWRSSTATDTYGTTGSWIAAMNSGLGVPAAYQDATETLGTYGGAITSVPADQRARLTTTYGTVELADGAAQHAIYTIGHLRSNAAASQAAIQALEDDSLSSRADLNTEVAVLNKINAANLIAVRSGQDTNQMLTVLAEEQAVQAKRTRDAEARAINQHIRFMNEGRAALTAQAAGASDAMLAWRMP